MTREEAIKTLEILQLNDIEAEFESGDRLCFFYPRKALAMAIEALEREPKWISAKERLPKNNEHIGNVCKYYLVQDEYGDMHVARHVNGKWFSIEKVLPFEDDIVAWQELPKKYGGVDIEKTDN